MINAAVVLAQHAFNIFGVGVGQAEVIGGGLAVGTTIVISFRLATRGKRYERG